MMEKQQEQPQGQQIQLKASDIDLKGHYSNLMQIAHTKEEFWFDFLNIMGQVGTLNARIIVSPGHAKRMIAALADNLKKYESQFGVIEAAKEPEKGPIGFNR